MNLKTRFIRWITGANAKEAKEAKAKNEVKNRDTAIPRRHIDYTFRQMEREGIGYATIVLEENTPGAVQGGITPFCQDPNYFSTEHLDQEELTKLVEPEKPYIRYDLCLGLDGKKYIVGYAREKLLALLPIPIKFWKTERQVYDESDFDRVIDHLYQLDLLNAYSLDENVERTSAHYKTLAQHGLRAMERREGSPLELMFRDLRNQIGYKDNQWTELTDIKKRL